MSDKLKSKIVTTSQLCEMYNVSRAAVYKWRQRGMPVHKKLGSTKMIKYNIDEVKEWLERNTELGTIPR